MPELTPIPKTPSREAHAEAVALFESHRNLFEHYARGAITIAPAPADLKTFAFDLEKNTIYMNSMFYKNLGLSDERTVFASFHEIEHFLEKRQILAEKNGEAKFKKYLDKIKKSRAFSLTDNCVADIHVNRTVVSKTNDAVAELEQGIYKEVLFKEKDFTKMPKHIQFPQALLREARVPDEKCVVDPEVRKYLDQVSNMVGKKSGKKFMDVLTDPLTTMSDRLDFQDRVIMPIVEKLKRQDIEEEKQKRKQDKKKKDQENKEQEKKDKEEGEDEGDQQENKDGQEEGEGESQKNEGDPENGEGESQK